MFNSNLQLLLSEVEPIFTDLSHYHFYTVRLAAAAVASLDVLLPLNYRLSYPSITLAPRSK